MLLLDLQNDFITINLQCKVNTKYYEVKTIYQPKVISSENY